MKKNPNSNSGIFNLRVLLAFALCSAGAAMLSFAATPSSRTTNPAGKSLSDSLFSSRDARILRTNTKGAASTVALTPTDPSFTVLHQFLPAPNTPFAKLIEGGDGNFYGTTFNGGTS